MKKIVIFHSYVKLPEGNVIADQWLLAWEWPDLIFGWNPMVRWFFVEILIVCSKTHCSVEASISTLQNMLLSAADVSLFGWFSFLVAKSFTVDHRMGSMKNFTRTSPLAERFTMDSSPLTRSRARRNLLWFMRRGRPEKLIHTSGYAWNVISLIIYMKNIYTLYIRMYTYTKVLLCIYDR